MATTKTISESVYNTDQSWYYAATLKRDTAKLRIEIRKNAYEFQSYGTIDLWDGTKWNRIHRIPGELLNIKRSYVEKGVTKADFSTDIKSLFKVATAVLD